MGGKDGDAKTEDDLKSRAAHLWRLWSATNW